MRNKELTLEITELCGVGCRWCSTSATADGNHVPLERIKQSLREQQPVCNVVRLSGGEPTLHPDIREIIWYAKYFLKYKVVLLTNGQRILGVTMRDYVDEFVVSLVNSESFLAARWYLEDNRNVSLYIVSAEGNEGRMVDAIRFAFEQQIPIHILALQKQGRGKGCEPSKLITWTGQRGCNKNRKVTINTRGNVTTCSAFKNRECDL